MPRTSRQKGAAATGSSGEMPHTKAATAPNGGAVVVHPGKGPAGSVSCAGSTRGLSGGAPTTDPGEVFAAGSVSARELSGEAPTMDLGEVLAAGSVSTWGMSRGTLSMDPGEVLAAGSISTRRMSGGAPTMDSGKVSAVSDSTEGMLQKKAAAAALSGDGAPFDPWGWLHVSDSSEGMLEKKAATAALSRGVPTIDPRKVLAVSESMEGMLQKKASVDSGGGSTASGALHSNTTAQDCEESAAKHRFKKARTVSSTNIPHEHCTKDEGDMGLIPKVETDIGLSVDMLHEHPAEEVDTAKGIQEPYSNEIVHVKEENTQVQEAELLIQQMDTCGIGEPISNEEFDGYFDRLPSPPCWIDLKDRLKDGEIDKQEVRCALYRLRYLKHKFSEQASKEELQDDKLKSLLDMSVDDCSQDFLEKECFFTRFEKDYTLDWFFHPDYLICSSLNDYQRLVLQNHGGTEYRRWSQYHQYLHSYKIEEEYLKYYEELSKKLKWMESYLDTSSVKWGYISSRGAMQAIKIAATDFHEITPTLAYNGFHECRESMVYDLTWFKELDGVYFEIWRRVTQQPMSFKDALEEVYKLDKFPVRQGLMKVALEDDYTLEWMKEEFQTCMEAITSAEEKNEAKELIGEGKAKELIREAVNKLVDKPKSYEQYIRKKIKIARVVGILPTEDESTV